MAEALGYQEEIPPGIDKKYHVFEMMNKLNRMRIQKRGCDLVIKVEDKEIPVHRNVMMVGSDFFDAMFTHDMQEKLSGVVEMKDISYRIFKKCVEFIYTGDISLVVGECEELLFVAGMLQLNSVYNSIAPFLESRLSLSSFFVTKQIADKFSFANLKSVCDEFALKNLDKLVKEKDFNSLEKEYISFLISTKQSIRRGSEDSKMAIVLQWIKADVENRNQYLVDLIDMMDFRKISSGYGRYLVKNELLCLESPQFMKMLVLALTDSSSDEEKPATVSFGSCEEKSLVVFDESSRVLRAYDPNSKNWTQMQGLHQCMVSGYVYTAVVIDNFIYVLLHNKKAFRLNTKSKQTSWESIPDMKRTHDPPQAAVCGEDIYVVGFHSMERYRASGREWREISSSGVSNCHYCALAVYDNSIYTIGGNGSSRNYLTDVNRYTPMTSSWSSVAPMPSSCRLSVAVTHDDKIYVAGGLRGGNRLHDFLSFSPRNNTWVKLSPMIHCRHYFQLYIIANQLYAVGDFDSSCSIEMYDFEEEKWKVVTNEDKNMKIMPPATVVLELPGS